MKDSGEQQLASFLVDNITALAGGGQTAAVLTGSINRLTTVATAADSVRLPAATAANISEEIIVQNTTANAAAVFPSTGDLIQTGAANAAFSVPAAKTAIFIVVAVGKYAVLLSA